ncbi:MAG: long-chain fatty acid--CoA ligase [Sphingomonas sp.]|nr:MAG: long-chain fatty acid--CoA ligase [Sphingomonas sp.]
MLSFGQILSALGGRLGSAPALIHGDEVVSWSDYDRKTNALANAFLAAGAQTGDRVAHLMRNSPAYLLTTGASFKARLVHVNVNYRYTGEELAYILDNSDSAVVVYDAEFAEVLETIRPRLTGVKLWLQVGGTPPAWAQDFDAVANGPSAPVQADHSADDMLFIYTGGTTGMPKGVMWDQSALWTVLGGGAPLPGMPAPDSLEAHIAAVETGESRRKVLALPPLMHGTGLLMGIYALGLGGTVITAAARNFSPTEALKLSEQHSPEVVVIVGDAFARPLLRAIEGGEGRLGQVGMMISSGTMWSPEIKAGLLGHCPSMICYDSYGSSEGLGYGASVSTAANADAPTRFMHDEGTVLVDIDETTGEKRVITEPGIPGRIARTGLIPRGYWKDPVKSAATFVTIGDQRYTMPGDFGVLEADGSIVLLGRGSQCINSGGEKIFPEEVEEALKTHPAVEDALVFGVKDEKWGQAVTAVVETREPVTETELIAHVKANLAAYKAPKQLVMAPKCPRAPNGKADYDAARKLAEEAGEMKAA